MQLLALAAERFHPQSGNTAPVQLRQHLRFETMKRGVKGVQRHLHRIKRKTRGQHLEMDRRVFVLGKADVSHFALLLCPVQGFGGAVRTNEKLGVIIE